MAKLKIKDGQGKERIHELVDAITTIGRASANILQVDDEKASRAHFRIEKVEKSFKVVDLGSTNGTRLNGKRVKGEVVLKPNDVILLGKTTFTYEDPDALPVASDEVKTIVKKSVKSDPPPAASGNATVELAAVDYDEKGPPVAALDEDEDSAPKYVLKVLEGNDPGKIYELGTKALTMGRHNSSTIQIIDDATSNYHAEINREPIGYVLTDLGSTNGTRVRHKNKKEFDKIIKTPLSPGMQIRVGKTLLEFENIGKPVEDDELFGTVSLEPGKLDAPFGALGGIATSHSAPHTGTGQRKLINLGLAALILIVVTVSMVKLLGTAKPSISGANGGTGEIPNPQVGNRIQNGDFEEGTDDVGSPRHFRIERTASGIRVSVVPDANHSTEGSTTQKLGLQISKGDPKTPASLTRVMTADAFPIDAGKNYEFKGWMRNDGDGLYGLHVTWIGGDRQVVDYPLVLKDQQEWKERTVLLSPPAWAQMARAGVFAQGKEGKAYFDSLSFRENSGGERAMAPSVKFSGVALAFEGGKGSFTAEIQGERAIEDGTLVLISSDKKYSTELSTAMQAVAKQESGRAIFSGALYDFVLGDATNYSISATPGSVGVDLRAAVDAAQENGCTPTLRFNVVGTIAGGEIEVTHNSDTLSRVQSSDDKKFTGVKDILFNAGKSPQLYMAFEQPADVEILREGVKRRVLIAFKGSLKLALAPENVQQKQKLQTAITTLNEALKSNNWGDAEVKLKALRTQYASRFAEARRAVDQASETLDTKWKETREDIERSFKPLESAVTAVALNLARNTVDKHTVAWTGSEKSSQFKTDLERINVFEKSNANDAMEQAASGSLVSAEKFFTSKTYSVALSYLKKILNNPEQAKTKAGEKARELLPKYQTACDREKELLSLTENLLDSVKSLEVSKDYKGAVDKIEKNKDYQQNKADLADVEKKLSDLRKKMAP